tara:strand:- start:1999 stop:2205 length:207 start_codon:yes stop_codon:yes gene_type:complete
VGLASTKINQSTIENLSTKDKSNMSDEWFHIQRWTRQRKLREQEEKNKESLNKKENSTVEDIEPKTQG